MYAVCEPVKRFLGSCGGDGVYSKCSYTVQHRHMSCQLEVRWPKKIMEKEQTETARGVKSHRCYTGTTMAVKGISCCTSGLRACTGRSPRSAVHAPCKTGNPVSLGGCIAANFASFASLQVLSSLDRGQEQETPRCGPEYTQSGSLLAHN